MSESVVVGAGIWGCTVARVLAERGKRVTVFEKRPAVGGNCRCETDPETGIEVHLFGSHIFHTSDPAVWAFVSRFTTFNDYRHVVLANHAGRLYHLPIGKTLYREFGTDDPKAIFDAFVRNYTAKQWGMPAEEVDPAVIRRLKVRDDESVRYFDDRWEGIPTDGYNGFFERLTDHPNITVCCGRAVGLSEIKRCPGDVFYSGPIDELFGYCHGALPWRTLRFETERLPVPDAQGTAVVNYVDAEVPFTRQHEYRHYHPERPAPTATIVSREYPAAWHPGDEPYYPVSSAESAARLAEYLSDVDGFNEQRRRQGLGKLTIGGRLGGYRYYDMDKSIAAALLAADERAVG